MINKIKQSAKNHLINMPGWKTNRKIVVFESDDWGSIRMPNSAVVEELRAAGMNVDACQYVMNDALETNDDMEALFDLLKSKTNTPVITANFLTANPDFNKIKESGFTQYYNEPLEVTLSASPERSKVKEYWFAGNEAGFFRPQLHGREHLNISRWMADLQQGNKETLLAFEMGTFGISTSVVKEPRKSYQAAFDIGNDNFKTSHSEIITDAVTEFEKIFGYRSSTFIAPNYVWGEEVEKTTAALGIKYLQGSTVQRVPDNLTGKTTYKRNTLGAKNKYGQKYLIRNAEFEPFSNRNKNWVDSCMKEIKTAFLWHKPAIISMHRANFVGSVRPENRERNLKLFSELIDKIVKKWPNVEFMSSDQLTKLMQ